MRFVTAAVSALALSVAPGAAMSACDDGEIGQENIDAAVNSNFSS